MRVVEENIEKQEVVMSVTEQKKRDFYHKDGWVTNPNNWYEKKERRGPYYGGKRWSFDAYHAKTDDEEDETHGMNHDVEEQEAMEKKVYNLRKIPIKLEDKDEIERDYYKNRLFYEWEDDEDDEDDDRGSARRWKPKRHFGETAFG